MDAKKRWLDVQEAAAYLGLSPKTLRNWLYEKKCPFKARKLGKLIRFDKEEIDKVMEAL